MKKTSRTSLSPEAGHGVAGPEGAESISQEEKTAGAPWGRLCGAEQHWGHSPGMGAPPLQRFRKARHASASNDFQTHLGQPEGLIDLPTSLLSLLSVVLQPL